jgi:hypothetical protein
MNLAYDLRENHRPSRKVSAWSLILFLLFDAHMERRWNDEQPLATVYADLAADGQRGRHR